MKAVFLILSGLAAAMAINTCSIPGKGSGVCLTIPDCNNRGGEYAAGYCPNDPQGVLCCAKIPCDSNRGVCSTSCSGTTKTGYCPGPSSFACCEGSGPSPSGWRPLNMDKVISGYVNEFGGQPKNVDDFKLLVNAAQADSAIVDIRWLAYMLATAKWEVANTWRPIEEYGKGAGRPYGKPVTVTDPATGQSYTNVYYGRGYVQLTWSTNYQKFGNLLGNKLYYFPALALDDKIAYQILSLGMRKGLFTGVGLSKYINDQTCDYYNARKIVNGLDQAETIAGYAVKFEKILKAASSQDSQQTTRRIGLYDTD